MYLSIYLFIYLSFFFNYDSSQQILAVGHCPPQPSASGNCITLLTSRHVSHVSLHVSRPTRSEATRAVSTRAARITACVRSSRRQRRGQKSHTLASNEFRLLMCVRTVREGPRDALACKELRMLRHRSAVGKPTVTHQRWRTKSGDSNNLPLLFDATFQY